MILISIHFTVILGNIDNHNSYLLFWNDPSLHPNRHLIGIVIILSIMRDAPSLHPNKLNFYCNLDLGLEMGSPPPPTKFYGLDEVILIL